MKHRRLALGILVTLVMYLAWWYVHSPDITSGLSSSIESAWHEVVPSLADPPDRGITKPEQVLGFINSLESRANVEVPKWWRDALMESRWGPGGGFSLGQVKGFDYQETGKQFKVSPGTILERNADKYVLSSGIDSIILPDGLDGSRPAGEMGVPFDFFSVQFTPTHFYVAAHMSIGTDFLLYCFERSSSERKWKKVIKWRGVDGSLVNPRTWVSIIEHDNQVFVFCMGTHDGVRVEGCYCLDGKSFLSFSGGWWKLH